MLFYFDHDIGCQVCPVGQLLNPLLDETMACSCTDPLFVIIQLLQQRLQNYTQSLENAFKDDLATFLKLSPSQVKNKQKFIKLFYIDKDFKHNDSAS